MRHRELTAILLFYAAFLGFTTEASGEILLEGSVNAWAIKDGKSVFDYSPTPGNAFVHGESGTGSASLSSGSLSVFGSSSGGWGFAEASISWVAGNLKYIISTSGSGHINGTAPGGIWQGNVIGEIEGIPGGGIFWVGIAGGGTPGFPGAGRVEIKWSLNKVEGEDPEDPIRGRKMQQGEEPYDDGSIEPAETDVSAYQIAAIPVVGSYGHTDSIYTKLLEPIHPVDKDHAHEFVTDNAYASMTIPTLPGNVGAYLLEFDGTEHTIAPGDTFDFTTFDPEGVRSFRLWPASSSDPLSALDVIGVRFFEEGPTYLFQGQVPEPSTLVLAAVAAGCGALARGGRKGPRMRGF